jgi:hypothetical protein
MTRGMTVEQSRQAEQIVRRWIWATRLSTPADRTVEQGAVGELAVALLDQLLREERRHGRLEAAA